MANPVVHFEIMGTDAARTQAYYRDLFGWEINADNPMNYGIVTAGGVGIGGGVGATPMGNKMVTVYVQVPDPQAALDRAVQLGGQVVMPVTEIPGMVTFALFSDPDGNVVGIVRE
jgi:predicted enzyme related to lactoylglutathione lyase